MVDLFLLANTLPPEATFRLRHLPWMLASVPMGMLVAATLFPERLSPRGRRWTTWLALGMCVVFLGFNLVVVGMNLHTPRDWDFKNFWFWGVALAEGTNPYDHANLLRIAAPLDPSDDLQREMRCVYPPPSLLLFAPLGTLDFSTALALWSLFQIGVFALCLGLLVHWFRPEPSWQGGLVIAALVLSYWGSAATLSYLQTNHLVLLALLYFWRDRHRPIAGLWLVLGTLAKPVAAPVGLYLLARGRWKGIGVCLLAALASLCVTWLIFGSDIFTQFLHSDGVGEHYMIAQTTNQSLSAVLLRATGTAATAGSLLTNPLILSTTLALIAFSSLLIYYLRGEGDGHALGLAIATALITYPATLTHYAVLLLLPLALILSDPPRRGLHRWGVVVAVALFFLLSALRLTFSAMLLAWGTIALCGLEAASRKEETEETCTPTRTSGSSKLTTGEPQVAQTTSIPGVSPP